MIGRISMDGGRRIQCARESILDMPFLHVALPRNCRPRHVRRAGRLLAKAGVRRAVVPAGFPYWNILEKCGVGRVEPGDFCRACAAPIALAALADPASATVILRGERVTRAMRMAALALCPQVRNLLVAAPVGGGALQAELRREYGVPALDDRPGRAADLAVHFSPSPGEGRRVLDLSGPCPGLDEFTISRAPGPLPEGTDRLPLMAVLWENGRISPGEVTVIPISDT